MSVSRCLEYYSVVVFCIWVQLTEQVNLGPGVVNTTYGPVVGKSISLRTGKQIVQFLGIPYANASRFEPPKSPTTWNTTLHATKYGKSCPQPPNIPPFNIKPDDISEYCLNLNVFAPNTTAFRNKSASYPVMLWLHGGGFILGTSSLTDATTMASEGNIVIVTVNYRLGALGFLSVGEDGLDGNYALLDVIEALRWVKANIQSFGGDPGNVTLGGWSAGARLVGVLMMSPQASGLYKRVIMMSGAAGGLYSYLEQKEALERARYFGGLLRCPHPSSDFKDCLKRKSTKEFIEAQAKMNPASLLSQWAPVVDGKLLPDTPPKLLAQGKFNGSSVLMGVANNDGSAFLNNIPGINDGVEWTKGLTRIAFEQAIKKKTWIRNQDDKVPAFISFQYTDWTKPNDVNVTRRQYLDILTDSIYTAPMIQSANAFAENGIPVFFYQSEMRKKNDVTGKLIPDWLNVTHRADLRYLFPKPDMVTVSGFTKTMMAYWIDFIKLGTPNLPNEPGRWPRYNIKDQQYQALRSFPIVQSKLRVEKIQFWNVFLVKNGIAEEKPTLTPRPEDDNSGDVTLALIVVSVLFGILFIVFLVVAIVIIIGRKEDPPPTNTHRYQPREPYSPPEKKIPEASPTQSYVYQNSMYTEPFKPIEKSDPYTPSTHDEMYEERSIDIVDQRFSTPRIYMDSDML